LNKQTLSAAVPRTATARLAPSINAVPRRAQQTQQQERVKARDAKLGDVRPKTNHQATKEERNHMQVSHDEAKKRFSLRCSSSHPVVAVVDYEIISPGVWDLKFTQVAPDFQHHGVADEVILRTMEFAQTNNIKIVSSCSYISETWFARHPEWKRLQVEEKHSQDGSKQGEQSLTYTDRVKKEANNAPDPQFTKLGNADNGQAKETSNKKSSQQSQEKQGQEMKQSEAMSNAKRSEKEPQAQAARELNEAMKSQIERGYRGYA